MHDAGKRYESRRREHGHTCKLVVLTGCAETLRAESAVNHAQTPISHCCRCSQHRRHPQHVCTPFDSNTFHLGKIWNERERVVKLGFWAG